MRRIALGFRHVRAVRTASLGALLALVLPVTGAQMAGAATEYPPDDHTVVLDHFNGATSGYQVGALRFVPSVPGLSKAAEYTLGTYTIHSVPGWYQWGSTYDPRGKRGTVEMWVFPKSWSVDLIELQWNWSKTPPSAGTIGKLSLTAEGELRWSVWTSIYCPPDICPPTDTVIGNRPIPLDAWTHVAVTWSPTNTRIYVGGSIDAEVPYSYYPALNPTFYVYTNPWGRGSPGYVDELRISDVARARFRTLIQPIRIDIRPGATTNTVNLDSRGYVPVAMLGSATFDVGAVIRDSVVFAGASPAGTGQSLADVNTDGYVDLVLKFSVQNLDLQPDDTRACLTGRTTRGEILQGCDGVRIVP